MALSVRKRGEIWHARGTVRVGRETIHVREFSTGKGSRTGALEVAAREARRIEEEHVEGAAGRARRLTLADCFEAHLTRPRRLQPYDEARIGALNELMGNRPLAERGQGWQEWLAVHPKASAGTVAR
jgi:hypothetical protein